MSIQSAAPASATSFDAVTVAAIATTVIGWASAFPAIRAGLEAFGPVELAAIRFGTAAVPAAIFLALVRPALPAAGEAWRFAFGGVVFVALYAIMLNIGEQTVSAGAASFIINSAPILTAILAVTWLGERFAPAAWLGTFISFAGIGLIAVGEGEGFHIDYGALLILGSALATGLNTIVQKPLFKTHRPLTVSMWNMVIGAVLLSPALPAGISQAGQADGEALFSAIYLGIVPSLIGYGAWATMLSRLPASRAANFLYCVPVVATLIGFLWLGEVPTLLGIIGGALALSGVAVTNLRR